MSAVLFMVFAIIIPYVSPKVRTDHRLRLPVTIVLIAHQIISLLQVAFNGLPTLASDPLAFNSYAMTGAGRLEADHYAQSLHQIYNLFGGSHLLGCQISNIFFSLALIVEIEILWRLGCERHAPKLILIFGLLPSCILNTSVIFREAAQTFLYLWLALLLLELAQRGLRPSTFLVLPVSLMLTYLHQAMAALLALCLPIALAWAMKARPAIIISMVCAILAGGVLAKDRILDSLASRSSALRNISSGDLSYIENYAVHVNDSRTNFGVTLDLSSPTQLIRTGLPLFTYYLFSPLPWQLRSPIDLYGAFESALRILLCVGTALAIRRGDRPQRDGLILLLLMFLTMELGWAAGTANWGTAFRHRIVAWGLLVAMGGAALDRGQSESNLPTLTKKKSIRQRRREIAFRNKGESAP